MIATYHGSIHAQTVWTGPTITFTKAANADWTLAANQDQITPNVWITRANNQGLFNIVTETGFDQPGFGTGISPQDTEWAIGTTSNISNLTFDTWLQTMDWDNGGGPGDLLNLDMVLHLITDDIYIDIKLLSWGSGPSGGGSFSYQRSTNNLSSEDFNLKNEVKLYPNPTSDFIAISGLTKTTNYTLYNILGKVVSTGTVANNQNLSVQHLPKGAYFIKLGNDITLKFIKD